MNYYKKSKRIFKKTIKEKNISKEEWDKFAQENCLFSANTLMFHVDAKSFEQLKQKFS